MFKTKLLIQTSAEMEKAAAFTLQLHSSLVAETLLVKDASTCNAESGPVSNTGRRQTKGASKFKHGVQPLHSKYKKWSLK